MVAYLLKDVLALDPARTQILLQEYLKFMSVGVLIFAFLNLTLAFYLRKWGMVAQLEFIMQSIRKISEGTVTGIELKQGLSTELVDIGLSINAMMKRLAMSQSKLEQREVLLRNSKEELELRVEERTLELEESKVTLEEQKSELMEINSELENQKVVLQEQNQRQEAFSEFLSYINSIEIETIIERTLLKLLEVCRYHFVVAYIYDESEDNLIPVYQYAMDFGKIERQHFASSEGLPRKILESNEWIKIEEFDDVSQPVIDLGVAQVEINNLYGIPLVFGNKKIGVLILGGLEKTTQESLTFLRDCMGPLCSALSNALSYQFIQVQSTTLKTANEELEKASKLKDQFLANISHEIRTPLNGIIGMTRLVSNTSLTPEQDEYVKIIKASGESLLTLINDILDLSKIEAGQLELEYLDVNLIEIIESVLEPIAFNKPNPDVEIYYNVSPDVPENLIADPTRMRQILINLVGNAAKFTKQGEIVVEVLCDGIQNGEAQMHFKVRDTGIGIEKEALKTIFESFVQADGSISRKYGGTGLGTTISKQLVEMMGGRIWLDSEYGVGTTFEYVVPLKLQAGQTQFQNRLDPMQRQTLAVTVGGFANWPMTLAGRFKDLGVECLSFLSRDSMAQWLTGAGQMSARDRLHFFLQKKENEPLDEPLVHWLVGQGFSKEKITFLLSIVDNDAISRCRELGFHFLTRPLKRESLLSRLTGRQEDVRRGDEAGPEQEMLLSSHLKILLAEDNLVNQKLALKLLNGPHLQIDVAKTGLEALQLYQQYQYDLVLMDAQMPEMGGLEATMKIRQFENDQARSRIPILAMTAHAMKGDRDKCIQAGMDDYITKPIMPKDLYKTIYSAVAHKLGGAEPGPSIHHFSALSGGPVAGMQDQFDPFVHPASNVSTAQPARIQPPADSGFHQQMPQNTHPGQAPSQVMIPGVPPQQQASSPAQVTQMQSPASPPPQNLQQQTQPSQNTPMFSTQLVEPEANTDLADDLKRAMFAEAGIPFPEATPEQGSPAPVSMGDPNGPIDMSVFNYDKALIVANRDHNFLVQLMDIYKEDFPNMLSGLKDAIASGNPSQVEAQAHGIKSGIVNIGAEKVAEIALTMEKEASEKDLANMQQNLGILEQEIERFYFEANKISAMA